MNEAATTVQASRPGGKWARSCYWRRPDGTITVDQYMGTALSHFTDRGYQRLAQYGDVTRFLDKERNEPDPGGNWGPILRHPDGPAEFEASQVLEARWYKPDISPVPGTRFPQLKGIKIQEYQCPQCKRLPFITAEGADGAPVLSGNGIAALGVHLQVTHSWDRLVLLEYGKSAGIDFNVAANEVHSVVEYEFEEAAEEVPEEVAPEFEVADGLSSVTAPVCDCGWETKANPDGWAQSLRTHKNLHCPLKDAVTA